MAFSVESEQKPHKSEDRNLRKRKQTNCLKIGEIENSVIWKIKSKKFSVLSFTKAEKWKNTQKYTFSSVKCSKIQGFSCYGVNKCSFSSVFSFCQSICQWSLSLVEQRAALRFRATGRFQGGTAFCTH